MTIKQTKLLTTQELNNYINKQRYKSIEVIESCNRESIEHIKRESKKDRLSIIIIKKWNPNKMF